MIVLFLVIYMMKRISKRITNYLIKNGIIPSTERSVYDYCVEMTIVMGISYLVFFILSFLFKEVSTSLVFLISFSIFRKTLGGYHANNYYICSIMTLLTYLFFIFTLKCFPSIFNYSFFIIIISCILIIVLSPKQHKNKPFTSKQLILFKIISKLTAFAVLTFTIITKIYSESIVNTKLFFSMSYGIGLSVFALIISYIERRKNDEEIVSIS